MVEPEALHELRRISLVLVRHRPSPQIAVQQFKIISVSHLCFTRPIKVAPFSSPYNDRME